MSNNRIILSVKSLENVKFLYEFLNNKYEVILVFTLSEVYEILKNRPVNLVITDMLLEDGSSFDLLEWIRYEGIYVPVIIISREKDIPNAVRTIKQGAFDFVDISIDIEKLKSSINSALEDNEKTIGKKNKFSDNDIQIIGNSPGIKEIKEFIKWVAPTEGRIIIYGDSGTGKELIARAIHKLSNRSNKPFVPINCSAIPSTLIESELFGHKKGAFTGAYENKKGKFELAEGGTIFLDEIADMPLEMQAKLLRVLEENVITPVGGTNEIKVDVRIIAATNKNLEKEMEQGKFRDDLYYRINTLNVNIQPLKERKEDIKPMVENFTKEFCRKNRIELKRFSDDSYSLFYNYSWPGNVRELKNIIERAVILSKENIISKETLEKLWERNKIQKSAKSDYKQAKRTLKEAKENFERDFIENILNANNWNISKSAKELNISRRWLYRKIKKLRIEKN